MNDAAQEGGPEDAQASRDAEISQDDAGADAGESTLDAAAVDASQEIDGEVDSDASQGESCFADSPTSTDGVSIHVEGDRCTFRHGEGGTFRYRVTLEQPIAYHVAASTSCGFCRQLGSDVGPLVRARVIAFSGAEVVLYCADCDVGCCAPNQEASYELTEQTYEGTLDWPGRSFNGPSDTGEQPGDFFPAGPAMVLISLELPDHRELVARVELPITIE